MKLVLKIAAGIVLAWGAILAFALVFGLFVAKTAQETMIKPVMQQAEKAIVEPLAKAGEGTPSDSLNPTFPTMVRPSEERLRIQQIQLCEQMNGQFINGVCRAR